MRHFQKIIKMKQRTKMSDKNNSISATTVAIKNGLNGATINTSSSSLTSSSSTSLNSSTGSGTTIEAAVTDSRIHVSRANPIHSSSTHNHHNTSNNNGSVPTTTTTSAISASHVSGIVSIKTEAMENDGRETGYHIHHNTSNNNGTVPTTTMTSAVSANHVSGNVSIKTEPVENDGRETGYHIHHNTSNNNGTVPTATTTSVVSASHVSGVVRIKTEPLENDGGEMDYTTCKPLAGGGGLSAAVSETKVHTSAAATIKRSSSLANYAIFPKNYKNETTCTKMSDENNSISATTVAIKNGLNGATINTSSSSLTSSSSTSLNSSTGSGTTIEAAVTDSRIHVSRANPIHSSSNHNHHNTSNNNGSVPTTATTSVVSASHVSGIVRIKTEPVENDGRETDYTTCKRLTGGAAGGEFVGRIPTSSSSGVAGSGAEMGGSVQGIGGRLQFFKDGKFILELARAKEGEKSGWVSVRKKQFSKNARSTSLSCSDDNSSIQSAPCQRDHCWKQSTPRRGISKELCFYFNRTKHIIFTLYGLKTARMKRRRPLDSSVCQTSPFGLIHNGYSIATEIEIKSEPNDDVTDAMDDEKSSDNSSTEKEDDYVRESSKIPTPESQPDTVDGALKFDANKTEDNQSKRRTPTTRTMNGEKRLKPQAKLTMSIKKLIDRLPTGLFHLSKTQIIGGATQQQHAHSNSHHQTHLSHHIASTSSKLASESHNHQQHVSPRKRILREFEKVSLEDTPIINSKRSRTKVNSSPAAAVGTQPSTPIPTSRGVVVPSSTSNYVTNGNRLDAISSNTSNVTPNRTPTRLNSLQVTIDNSNSTSSTSNSNSNKSNNNNSTKILGNHRDGTNVCLNDSMTSHTKELFNATKKVKLDKKYKYMWMKNNTIFLRKKEGDDVIKVRSLDDLCGL